MNNTLPLALAYLQRGYSVIPVGPNKRPLIPWKEFQSRLATPEELVGWWTTNPEAQIGIITGKVSNLTVIDVEAEGDFGVVTEPTYTVETGGKGRHYYFKYEPEFRNAVRIFPAVDVRSEGGYVVAAGSETQKGVYQALNTLEVAMMAPDTKTRFLGATKRRLEASTPEVTNFSRTDTGGLEYAGFGAGMRNDEMTRYAGAVHAKIHPSLWPSIGLKMFEEANLKNTPPLSTGELRVIWNSIGQAEQRQNPGGRIFTPSAPKTWGPAEEIVSPEAVQEGEVDPKDTLHASEVARLQTIDSASTYPVDMKPFDDALLGGFSLGELVVVAGQSGHGKTTLIQDWTTTLASGGKTNRDKLPVLWFSYEVLARPLWEKFEKMGATPDTPLYMPRFNETGELTWVVDVIEQAIVKWGIKVVAIDHLGFLRAPRGNYANAADSVTHTVRALKKLAVKRGLIICLPVHIRKTNSDKPDLNDIRDSLGIAQESDTVFFIGRQKDHSGMPTPQARVSLIKNRKSGIAVSSLLDFQFGRYFFDENSNKMKTEGGYETGEIGPDSGQTLKQFDDF